MSPITPPTFDDSDSIARSALALDRRCPGPHAALAAFIAGIPAAAGEAVERSCGRQVAGKTWQVVLGDGEYGLALVSYYLVLRQDGWKVWGTLEGHGETTPPFCGDTRLVLPQPVVEAAVANGRVDYVCARGRTPRIHTPRESR
jgi:hypothetical protein